MILGLTQRVQDFAGVEYGYGDIESMKKEGGRVFVKTTAELLDVLTK